MPAAAVASAGGRVNLVRAFNRFDTREIGVLNERPLHSPYPLAYTRVLYELAHRDRPTATALGRDLGLDAGYMSRILRRFEHQGLVTRTTSREDRRRSLLQLTRKGRAAFAPLDRQARTEVAGLLERCAAKDQREVVAAMATIKRLLDHEAPASPGYILRGPEPGDMGWIVHRHGAIYAREWRYNGEFEALVARICADFLDTQDRRRERCWIAERNGEIVGSVFVVRQSRTVAKLRLLLVEPGARGHGHGARLVDECIRFARAAGYRTLALWTQSELTAARRIYERAGFRCVETKKHDSFGRQGLVAETWTLSL